MSSQLNKYRDEARILRLMLDNILWPLTHAGFQDSNSTHEVNLSSDVVPGLAVMCTWLRPYIAELCLKSLYELETAQDAERTHDLIKLFDNLTPDTQSNLQAAFESHVALLNSSSSNLRELLEAHRGHFMEWRYLHEQNASPSELTLLDKAIAAMFENIQDMT